MGNLLEYLDWRGDLSFDIVPFGDVDNLILSELSYMDFGDILPSGFTASLSLKDAVNRFLLRLGGKKVDFGAIIPDTILLLAEKARDSRRFSSLQLTGFRNQIDLKAEGQFSALTFRYRDDFAYCAFRGTDDTLVGWKEDFNLAFLPKIPAQQMAADYVDLAAEMLDVSRFYFGGHSKGGNLALYAAVCCGKHAYEKLDLAFSNDGPGFSEEFVQSEAYASRKEKFRRILPDTSVVGMLLENDSDYTVVESNQSGLFQHDGFSWKVLGGNFITCAEISHRSKQIDRQIRTLLSSLGPEERSDFVSQLYELLSSSGAETLTDLLKGKLDLFRAYQRMDPGMKKLTHRFLSALTKVGKNREK